MLASPKICVHKIQVVYEQMNRCVNCRRKRRDLRDETARSPFITNPRPSTISLTRPLERYLITCRLSTTFLRAGASRY